MLDLELLEKSEMFKKATGKRETVGITLYQTQQQLARLQSLLDGAQESYDKANETRLNVETVLTGMKDRHQNELDSLREREQKRNIP